MGEVEKIWDGAIVRKWLERRLAASQDDQDQADRHGHEREDEYDKAAAEEWVCRLTKSSDTTNDQQRFAEWLKVLLDRDDYHRLGVHSERRFEREVRAYLRKLIEMTKANAGFENLSRYQ